MIARVLLGPRPPKRARLPRPERAPSLLPGALLSVLSVLSALLVLLGAVGACKDSQPALAELVQVSGSGSAGLTAVERATGADDWRQAKLGTKFFLGDAARTGDATAQLRLGDASRLAMEPHTILRFGRRGDTAVEQQLLVELGSIELVGSGAYQFDIGEISVERNGGVRISAADDGSRVELLVGQASIRTGSGAAQPLQPGAV
ncbi:MAG TPA: hypothetical protein PKU97_12735, partial [Kofleriaceae bacterium]|nr:hypothetical protein [Kofleriaceae bacterium]